MDVITIQYLVIGSIFLLAVIFLVRRTRHSLKGKSGCAKGCGCEFSEKGKNSILAASKK